MSNLLTDFNLARARFIGMPSGQKAEAQGKQSSIRSWSSGDCPVCSEVFCVFRVPERYGGFLMCYKCGHKFKLGEVHNVENKD